MDKLPKEKRDELATVFALLALYDGGAEVTSDQISTLLKATGNSDVAPHYPIIFANFLSTPEKIRDMIAVPAARGGGCSDGKRGDEMEVSHDEGDSGVAQEDDSIECTLEDPPIEDMFGGDGNGDY